jgi:hypothetical protein
LEAPEPCARPTPRDNAGVDNSRRIAFSAKGLTLSHGRALVRAVIEFRHAKRLASRSSRFWRVAFRVCLAIAAPFIVIAIFALGAAFGWPATVGATVALVTLCVWRDRHQMPERLATLRPANVVPTNANTLVKILCYITKITDENTLWNELWRAWYWIRGMISGLIVLGGLIAVEELFGLAAMFIAGAAVVVLLNRQNGGGVSADEAALLLGDSALLPPGKPQLPPSGAPQIGRASTALTPSRPGPVARR